MSLHTPAGVTASVALAAVVSLLALAVVQVLLDGGGSLRPGSMPRQAAAALPAAMAPFEAPAQPAGTAVPALPAGSRPVVAAGPVGGAAPTGASPRVAADTPAVEVASPAKATAAAPARYPVPYTLAAGLTAALLSPGASPPGANDWYCKPTAAHPEPVVLLHGLLGNMTDNWQTMAPLLADNGYCVYALTYGALPGASFPLDQFGGLLTLEQSAQEISQFVDQVLAATGASKVDVVGHSEGATLPTYYAKFLGGAAKIDRYVGIAPVYHGTTLGGLGTVASQLAAAFPGGAQAVGQICGSCQQFLVGSTFLQKLDAGAVAPGVTYTNIVTRFDEAVVPFTSGLLTGGNVTNIVVQDQCGLDLSDHLGLAADPIVGRDVLNALDPAHAESPACSLVLPFIG